MNSKIEEELERSGKILQTTIGDSMEPMLQNRQNIVVIEKADGLLKKYDLPLYRRPNGKYVLHRILKVRKNDYIICGDNRIRRETVPHEWIIGVVSGYYKGKKFISIKDRKYLLYVHIWCDFYYVRAALLWLKSTLARIKRKLKRKG